jgi:hypothetical protein
MKLCSTTYLRWREPTIVRQSRDAFDLAAVPVWERPILVFVNVGVMLFVRYLTTLNPNKQPISFSTAVILGVLQGLGFFYLLPWVYRLVPCSVRMTDTGIILARGDHSRVWKYATIAKCEFVLEGEVTLLAIVSSGRSFIIGIDPAVPVNDVRGVLEKHGVQIGEHAAPVGADRTTNDPSSDDR